MSSTPTTDREPGAEATDTLTGVVPDLPVGEYADISRTWRKWRELTPPKKVAKGLAIPFVAIGVQAVFQVIVNPSMAATWVSLYLGAFALMLVAGLMLAVGEPFARFRRIYAAAGRVDIVTMGTVESYTSATHTLESPKYGYVSPGTIQIKGPGYTYRTLYLAPSDIELLTRLWNLPTIAPPFGSVDDNTATPRGNGSGARHH